jgi:hypothetical protein
MIRVTAVWPYLTAFIPWEAGVVIEDTWDQDVGPFPKFIAEILSWFFDNKIVAVLEFEDDGDVFEIAFHSFDFRVVIADPIAIVVRETCDWGGRLYPRRPGTSVEF